MTRMGTVWDRTSEVLSGRGGMLAGIAALTVFLPSVVHDAVAYALGGGDPAVPPAPASAMVIGIVGIVVAIVTIYGQLALVAAASDPATGRSDAFRIAGSRLLPSIGLVILLGLVFLVLLIPFVAILVASHVDMAGLRTSGAAALPAGTAGSLALYMLVFGIVALWINARLAVLLPVIVNERLGTGSFARGFALTRGHTWRIVGLLILFAIVAVIAISATQMVAGVVFRLILGADRIALALLLTGFVVAVVTTVVTIVYSVFVAQLYVARRDELGGVVAAR